MISTHKLAREVVTTLGGSTFYGTREAAAEQQAEIIERAMKRLQRETVEACAKLDLSGVSQEVAEKRIRALIPGGGA